MGRARNRALERHAHNFHERISAQFVSSGRSVVYLWVFEFVVVVACAAHDLHSAFNWSLSQGFGDNDMVRDKYIGIATLHHIFDVTASYLAERVVHAHYCVGAAEVLGVGYWFGRLTGDQWPVGLPHGDRSGVIGRRCRCQNSSTIAGWVLRVLPGARRYACMAGIAFAPSSASGPCPLWSVCPSPCAGAISWETLASSRLALSRRLGSARSCTTCRRSITTVASERRASRALPLRLRIEHLVGGAAGWERSLVCTVNKLLHGTTDAQQQLDKLEKELARRRRGRLVSGRGRHDLFGEIPALDRR